MKATIYHNTKCSKSNAALNLLLAHGVEVEIFNYLETPLSSKILKTLINTLGIEAKDLIRFGEPITKELGLNIDDIRDEQEWISLMVQHPIMIERPVVVINNKAAIARPPEMVLEMIQSA